MEESNNTPAPSTHLEGAPTEAERLRDALQTAVETIQDYLAYEHDGDPWSEDSRAMGEMDINDYAKDGRLDYALSLLAEPTHAKGALPDEKPNAPTENRPEWIWYCESTSGVPVVTFGRWPKHSQQARYKLADVQPTEHDHPHVSGRGFRQQDGKGHGCDD